jgi:hypothetical protein
VDRGLANSEQRKILAQLQDTLTKESREAGSAPFIEIQTMAHDAVGQRIVRDDLPMEFIGKMLGGLAEATMEFIALHPKMADKYRTGGFEICWAGSSQVHLSYEYVGTHYKKGSKKMKTTQWTFKDIPPQTGRLAMVTGAK